jgi:hypothetical protein
MLFPAVGLIGRGSVGALNAGVVIFRIIAVAVSDSWTGSISRLHRE